MAFNLKSDFARSNIQGSGRLDLAAGYPVNAQLTFTGVTWSGLSPLLSATAQPFDASLDGSATVSGPAARPEAMQGNVQLTKLEAHAIATGAAKAPRVAFEVRNTGNVQVSLANSVVTVQNFHLSGPYADLAIAGTASLKAPQTLNLRANGNFKLDALEAFSSDIFSSGAVTLNATATGDAVAARDSRQPSIAKSVVPRDESSQWTYQREWHGELQWQSSRDPEPVR